MVAEIGSCDFIGRTAEMRLTGRCALGPGPCQRAREAGKAVERRRKDRR